MKIFAASTVVIMSGSVLMCVVLVLKMVERPLIGVFVVILTQIIIVHIDVLMPNTIQSCAIHAF